MAFIEALLGGSSGGSGNIIGGTTLPSNIDGENGDIYVGYSDYTNLNIPDYTAYEYIQNAGVQRVYASDIRPTTDMETEVKVVFQNVQQGSVFGIDNSENGYRLYVSNSKIIWNTQSLLSSEAVSVDSEYIIKVNSSSLTVNGVTYTGSPSAGYSNGGLSFFSSYTSNYGRSKLYYVKIRRNGTLIHHLVPAKANSGGSFGLYDLVTNSFYAGDGGLLVGDVAVGKPIDSVFLKKNNVWIPIQDAEWTDINV